MHLLPEPTKIWNTRTVVVFMVVCLCVLPLFTPVLSQLTTNVDSIPIAQNDFDGDLIVNTIDIDDDNDGIPDTLEITENGDDIDSDRDGQPDRLDLDSDNDGILDWQESGALIQLDLSEIRKVGPRLVGEIGTNGLIDAFESPIDMGVLSYSLANVDSGQDDVPDFLDLDSDNDGWPDLREAGVSPEFDSDGDARVDAPPGTVGQDGVPDVLQQMPDQSCCDLDGDGDQDVSPVNTDLADLPDFQDLDSDNDGVYDIVELNGTDIDGNGRVDNFLDTTGGIDGPDGMDDGLNAFPLMPKDDNGNGVEDHVDFEGTVVGTGDQGGADPGQQPVPAEPDTEMPQSDPVEPDASPAADDGDSGLVRTGLNSSGCSVASTGQDSLLLLMIVFSAVVLGWRQAVRWPANAVTEQVNI